MRINCPVLACTLCSVLQNTLTVQGKHTCIQSHARTHTGMQIQPTGLNINVERKQIEAPRLVWVLCVSGNERLFCSNQNNWVILE